MNKKILPYVIGGVALALIAGGLTTFLVATRNTPKGGKEFSLVDTWKAVSYTSVENPTNGSLIYNEYLVVKENNVLDYYKGDLENPMFSNTPYEYVVDNSKLVLSDLSINYTVEKKTNNFIRLINGNGWTDYIRYHGTSFTSIDVPANPFEGHDFAIKYRQSNTDYSGQHLTFKDGMMTQFSKDNTTMASVSYAMDGKVLVIDAIGKRLNLYPVDDKVLMMVEAVGEPGYIWELHLNK